MISAYRSQMKTPRKTRFRHIIAPNELNKLLDCFYGRCTVLSLLLCTIAIRRSRRIINQSIIGVFQNVIGPVRGKRSERAGMLSAFAYFRLWIGDAMTDKATNNGRISRPTCTSRDKFYRSLDRADLLQPFSRTDPPAQVQSRFRTPPIGPYMHE